MHQVKSSRARFVLDHEEPLAVWAGVAASTIQPIPPHSAHPSAAKISPQFACVARIETESPRQCNRKCHDRDHTQRHGTRLKVSARRVPLRNVGCAVDYRRRLVESIIRRNWPLARGDRKCQRHKWFSRIGHLDLPHDRFSYSTGIRHEKSPSAAYGHDRALAAPPRDPQPGTHPRGRPVCGARWRRIRSSCDGRPGPALARSPRARTSRHWMMRRGSGARRRWRVTWGSSHASTARASSNGAGASCGARIHISNRC